MKTYKRCASTLLTASVVLGSMGAWASVPVSGVLTAQKNCEAFVSKRTKSNPDKARLEPGDAYPIIEQNRPEGADWYRVQVADAAVSQERWVESTCGMVALSSTPAAPQDSALAPSQPRSASLCSTPDLADSYVLAISWQPAFCEGHRTKKECAVGADTSYQKAGNFTLHGLWPNLRACKQDYGSCTSQPVQKGNFCNYPAVDMNDEARKVLTQVMPGTASCLERHEWWKHGTCQTDWDASQYFEVAASLLSQFNDSGMKTYMASKAGSSVKQAEFLAQVDKVLVPDASKRLRLLCSGGKLTEIRITLPVHLTPGAQLKELITQSPLGFASNCSSEFTIDAVGF